MSFHEVSSDAEKLLQEIFHLYRSDSECSISLKDWNNNKYEYNANLYEELLNAQLCVGSINILGITKTSLTGLGKNYFLRKQSHKEQEDKPMFILSNIDNSALNFNTGSGQANQTVSIYTNEQYTAINEFREEVQSSALSQEEKAEVLELLDSMEELKAKNKTSSFKALVNRVNEIVTTSNTLHAIWQGVVQLFGI